MPAGLQLAQSCHVVFAFSQDFPDETKQWMNNSNYICCLSVNNEEELHKLIEKANKQNIKYSIFKEPDIGDKVTAIALQPSLITKKLCSNLKLAMN